MTQVFENEPVAQITIKVFEAATPGGKASLEIATHGAADLTVDQVIDIVEATLKHLHHRRGEP